MPTFIEELVVHKLRALDIEVERNAVFSAATFETLLTTGTLTSTGAAVFEELMLSDTVWEDMRFPATRTKLGSNDKPDFDYTNIGLLFPQNNTGEIVYVTDQTPHAMIETDVVWKPHIHYIQTGATMPTFTLSQRIYANGAAPPAFASIDTTGEGIFTYTSDSMLQILPFPDIEVDDSLGVSAWFDFKLFRDDNDVTGDVLFKGFDFHYPLDRLGSREVYSR
jgi:hypothetical protein